MMLCFGYPPRKNPRCNRVAVSLGGVGPEETRVRVIADPRKRKNVHEMYVRGELGEVGLTVSNVDSITKSGDSAFGDVQCVREYAEDTATVHFV